MHSLFLPLPGRSCICWFVSGSPTTSFGNCGLWHVRLSALITDVGWDMCGFTAPSFPCLGARVIDSRPSFPICQLILPCLGVDSVFYCISASRNNRATMCFQAITPFSHRRCATGLPMKIVPVSLIWQAHPICLCVSFAMFSFPVGYSVKDTGGFSGLISHSWSLLVSWLQAK